MNFSMVIAQCPYCGCRRYSFDVIDAVDKLRKHKCPATKAEREVIDIVRKKIDGQEI